MKSFFQTIKNIYNIKELREKLILTFTLILIYRLGAHIPLPGIDLGALNEFNANRASGGGFLDLLNSFTGGAFNRASVMALGIMPYISASIVIQLLGLAVPYFQKLQKEGESGRKTITQITRWLTIVICLVQAPGFLTLLTNSIVPYGSVETRDVYIVPPTSMFEFIIPSVILLITGTIFAMWLGEKITDRGIGNGISIIIMIGILADLPGALISEFNAKSSMIFVIEILGLMVAILLSVILVSAVRKVPLQYVRRATAGGSSKFMKSMTQPTRSYLPLKVNAAGVMPIIFAQAIMFVPGLIAQSVLSPDSGIGQFLAQVSQPFTLWNSIVFGFLIIIFTYFYTAITIPVNQIAEGLKRDGAIIPGMKPGQETANYLDHILSLITLPGSIYLALLAILPAFVALLGVNNPTFAYFFGGTSMLIMVGVIIDTAQQINTYLLNHHYDGLMQSGRTTNNVA